MYRLSAQSIQSALNQQNAQRVPLFHSETEKSNPPVAHKALPDTATFNDPQYDETVIDFDGADAATITQVDEAGINHTIILSPDMLRCIFYRGLAWKAANQP